MSNGRRPFEETTALDAAAAIHQWNGAEKRLGANCSGAKLGWQAKSILPKPPK
jgi:hypothetical protein